AHARGAWPEGTPMIVAGPVTIPSDRYFALLDLKAKKYVSRGREMPEPAARRYRVAILDRLSYHDLLRQEAEHVSVDYDKSQLNARSEQQRRGIRDWTRHLERRGETDATLEAMLIAELRERAILEASGALAVSRSDIEAEYEQIKSRFKSSEERLRVSHVLIPIGGEGGLTEADAKARAQDVRNEAVKPGADFGALARTHSTGPSASKGGDLGIVVGDRMAEEFMAAAKALEVGGISEPVRTKFGYHVIRLAGRWPKGELPIEALEDQITARLKQHKMHAARRALKKRLFEDTPVQWWLDTETGDKLTEAAPARPIVSESRRAHGHEEPRKKKR
ncbi:MAG: peptidylprolyl isomerase, partial [Myxococcota bacterium]